MNNKFNIQQSEEFEKRLLSTFQQIDQNNDEAISIEELRQACNILNINLTDQDIQLFFQQDINNDKVLQLQEYRSFVLEKLKTLFEQFQKQDENDCESFHITKSDIFNLMKNNGVDISERQIDSIIFQMDKNKDKKIDFKEFCEFFADLPSPTENILTQKIQEGFYVGTANTDLLMINVPPPQKSLWVFALAGGFGGICSRCITAPIEKIKILLQTQTNTQGQQNNLKQTIQNVIKNEGLTGFFQGNLVNCIRVFPTSAIACLVYSRMIKYTPVDNKKNPDQPLWRFISGFLAGIISTSLTHPLDVLRARLTVQKQSINLAWKQIKQEKAYFKGLSPTLLTIAPFMGIQQSVYDLLRLHFIDQQHKKVTSFLICGSIAGLVAQTITHPLDVVRRISQVQQGQQFSALQIMKQIQKTNKSRYFSGLGVSYFKSIPAVMTSLVGRDYVLGRI